MWASVFYLGTTVLLFSAFVAIVVKTYSKSEKEKLEEPKYRMMDE